jgi:phage repressor protein C with HTH and peptisase S24 domain
MAKGTILDDPVRRLIVDRLQARNLDMANVSRAIGRNHAYLFQFLTKGSPAELPEKTRIALAAQLLVDESALRAGGAPSSTPQRERANARIGNPIEDPFNWQTIPVYGQAVGGVDGRFIFNGQKITDVIAPPSLSNVADAYAVYVVGESMEPRYFAGETIYVHPRLPIRKGDFVVVQLKADEENENEKLGYVKQFLSMDDRRIRLTQFNPVKTLEFSRRDVISVHKIILAG